MPPVPLAALPAPEPPEPGVLAPPSTGFVPLACVAPGAAPGAPIVAWPPAPMPVLLVLLPGVEAVVGVLGVVTVVLVVALGVVLVAPVVRVVVVGVDWQPAARAAAAAMPRMARDFMVSSF